MHYQWSYIFLALSHRYGISFSHRSIENVIYFLQYSQSYIGWNAMLCFSEVDKSLYVGPWFINDLHPATVWGIPQGNVLTVVFVAPILFKIVIMYNQEMFHFRKKIMFWLMWCRFIISYKVTFKFWFMIPYEYRLTPIFIGIRCHWC